MVKVAQIIEGDALQEMVGLEGGQYQALVTDPPYCSGARDESDKMGGRSSLTNVPDEDWFDGDSLSVGTYQWFIRECALEWYRLLTVGGSVLIFTDWRMQNYVRPVIESVGFIPRNLVVWDKTSIGPGNGFRHQHELILHFTKGGFEPCANDVPNVLQYQRTWNDDHPTQKPVPLLEDLLRVVAKQDDHILDPFAGSGSTGVAAVQRGMDFTGIERDPTHAETARSRLDNSYLQERIGENA